jgi:DNA helicase-2/ATP-dependent DNA helicase PcrA
VSFRRIINTPPRGIGAAVLNRIEQDAKKKSLSLFDTVKSNLRGDHFTQAVKAKLADFIKMIERVSSAKYKSTADMVRTMYEKSGYAEVLDEERVKNIEELISSAEGMDIKEFLDRVSLITSFDDTCGEECISLMTLHNAKGLEFPVVFIIGIEEGVLPYFKAMKNEEEIAEERRLFYVGMTRAKDVLWLTGANKRRLYAKFQDQEPSRFLRDIPREWCHWIDKISGHPAVKVTHVKKDGHLRDGFSFYNAGCRVKHPAWGVGVVRDCYGDGDDQKVMVNFPNFGVKRLAVRFANLEKM